MGYLDRLDDEQLSQIAKICRHHGVRELLLFGSVLGPSFHVGSDIDFLVEFLPGKKIGLFEYAGMRIELERLLQRKVDLVSKRGLNPRIRDEVLFKTWTVYAA
jgi:predicted nucleotidyltransferase